MEENNLKINWFPGHMKKTLDDLKKNVKGIDAAIYVLDARAWFSCLNPSIDSIVEHKKVLYIINKSDLIAENDQKNILKYFKNANKNAICVSGTSNSCKKTILERLNSILEDRFVRSRSKGIEPVFKIMVIGTPNTGKSTIINTLYGKKKAKTQDIAGVTRQNQWVKISDNYVLLDTPGTLWPKMENYQTKLYLAFIGSVKKDVVDQTELGFEMVKWLIKNRPDVIKERYGVEAKNEDELAVYEAICVKVGAIMRGGELDYTRGSTRVLEDFRSGRLGKICLEDAKKL